MYKFLGLFNKTQAKHDRDKTLILLFIPYAYVVAMHFLTSMLLLACFQINLPFVLRLRPMKNISGLNYPKNTKVNTEGSIPTSEVELQEKMLRCGPVPFPDFRCEVKKVSETTIIVILDQNVKTTVAPSWRPRPLLNKPNQEDDSYTSSTVPFGWDGITMDEPMEVAACQGMAKCDIPVWNDTNSR